MKNTIVENGLLLESNVRGQYNPVSKTDSEKDALMAEKVMKLISAMINFFHFSSLCKFRPVHDSRFTIHGSRFIAFGT